MGAGTAAAVMATEIQVMLVSWMLGYIEKESVCVCV
jgi:hypothetical protein